MVCKKNPAQISVFCHLGSFGGRQRAQSDFSRFLLVLGLFSKFEIFKDFLNNKISISCVRHFYVTSIVQALDFWLTRESPV
jgi:hypothetical protein